MSPRKISTSGRQAVAARPARNLEPLGGQCGLDGIAALGMTRNDDRQQAIALLQGVVNDPGRLFLALEGGDRRPGLSRTDLLRIIAQRLRIVRRRVGVDLEIARNHHRQRAERAEALRIDIGLGDDEREVLEQRIGERRPFLPAGEGPVRKAPVDQNLRNVAPSEFDDRHRPDFRFGDDRQIRLPVFEEAAHRRLEIERHILMDDGGAQTLGGDARRGRGPGGQDHGDAAAADFLDQRGDRNRFPNTGRMKPDERPRRARRTRMAVAFAPPGRILLALRRPHRQVGHDEGVDRRAEPAIAGQRKPCAQAAHERSPLAALTKTSIMFRIEQPVHVNDEITHMGVVDRHLRLGLPGNVGALVIGEDTDDVEVVEITELHVGERRQLAAEDKVQELLLLGILSHCVPIVL